METDGRTKILKLPVGRPLLGPANIVHKKREEGQAKRQLGMKKGGKGSGKDINPFYVSGMRPWKAEST